MDTIGSLSELTIQKLGQRSVVNFFFKPLDWKIITDLCPNFWIVSSDNDPIVSTDNHHTLVTQLKAKEILEHNKKHLTGDDGMYELQSVLNAIKELSKSN